MPRRDAVLAIAQEIEELNNANLAAQRAEVARRQAAFRTDLHRLLWQTLLLGLGVALTVVFRLRVLERRSRRSAEATQMRQLSQQLVATQEEERKNLSRELHDHVAQVLTALRMELGRIERMTGAGDRGPAPSPNASSSSTTCSAPSAISRSAFGRACSTTSACSRRSNGTCATSRAATASTSSSTMDGDLDALPDSIARASIAPCRKR